MLTLNILGHTCRLRLIFTPCGSFLRILFSSIFVFASIKCILNRLESISTWYQMKGYSIIFVLSFYCLSFSAWPFYCLVFFSFDHVIVCRFCFAILLSVFFRLAILLSVLFSFGHVIVSFFVSPFYCLSFFISPLFSVVFVLPFYCLSFFV